MKTDGTNPEIKYIREGEVKKLLKEKDAIIAKRDEQIAEYEKVLGKYSELPQLAGFELVRNEFKQVLKKWANESEVEK